MSVSFYSDKRPLPQTDGVLAQSPRSPPFKLISNPGKCSGQRRGTGPCPSPHSMRTQVWERISRRNVLLLCGPRPSHGQAKHGHGTGWAGLPVGERGAVSTQAPRLLPGAGSQTEYTRHPRVAVISGGGPQQAQRPEAPHPAEDRTPGYTGLRLDNSQVDSSETPANEVVSDTWALCLRSTRPL